MSDLLLIEDEGDDKVDNRFKELFSSDTFGQYSMLPPQYQQELRNKFKEMFMPNVGVGTAQAAPSISHATHSTSKQG